MKSFITASVALALAGSALAWDPPCNWENCLTTWNHGSCDSSSNWECLCTNGTAIDEVNTCVTNSCEHWTDQEAIYAAIDQLCADQGVTVTNSPEATFSMTSGGSSVPTIRGNAYVWDQLMWDDWLASASATVAGVPLTSVTINGAACVPVTGATASWGPWSAAWTWTDCSGTSPLPTTLTMTMTSGSVTSVTTTSTTLYVAAAATASATAGGSATVAAQSSSASATASSTSSSNAAAPTQNAQLVAAGGAVAAVFGLMAIL